MKKSHILLSLIVALGLVLWFLVWPAYQSALLARADSATWQKKLSDAKDAKQKLDELQQKYQTYQEQEDRILTAIPNGEDVPGLLVQLEALASQNGLVLNSLNFIYPNTQSGARAAAAADSTGGNAEAAVASGASGSSLPTGVSLLSVVLNLNGNYAALKNFLTAIENNLRLTDVYAISFEEAGGAIQAGGLNKVSVSLNVYYKQ